MSRSLRILMAGTVAGNAMQGGAAWAVLQYVLGLQRLGHRVHLVEPTPASPSDADAYFTAVMRRYDVDGERLAERRAFTDYDMVMNISGVLDGDAIAAIPIRVYLDLDPVFNQLWNEAGIERNFAAHNHFVTVGQAIGQPGCDVPTQGRAWIPTLPPVVLQHWPSVDGVETDAFTTVGNFRSYGSIEHNGMHYGQKAHSLRNFVELPRRSGDRFLLAMEVAAKESRDLAALIAQGWQLVDPRPAAGTPDNYRSFIQGSLAEIGIAKSGYVISRSGWFSDRSACYLASGRPVVAQDTGIAAFVPVGEGLLVFEDTDGAVAAVQEVRRDYDRHSRNARHFAEEFLDSDRVLKSLLERVGA